MEYCRVHLLSHCWRAGRYSRGRKGAGCLVASYDLSLGDEYYYGGRIRKLSESDPILLLAPYDYVIVTSHEVADFPREVTGRFDLTVSLFCQGLFYRTGRR